MIEVAFQQVLLGPEFQVIKLPHPWLTVLVQNMGGHAALLVRASLTPEQVLGDGRGFAVKTERNGNEDYVRISSTAPGLPPVFLKLIEYVLDRTRRASSKDGSLLALINSVDEFRRFSLRRSGRLTEEEIRGLFAELLLFRRFIENGVSITAITSAWRGALAREGVGIHDFTFPSGRGIEVKSTHQPPLEVRVSSPAQLVPSELPLDLVVLPVEDVPSGNDKGIHFRSFVTETGLLVSSGGPTSWEKWNKALAALGLDIEDEYYDQWCFLPGAWSRFAVREGFPSVESGSLPKAVIRVTYSLELQHLSQFAEPFADLVSLGDR